MKDFCSIECENQEGDNEIRHMNLSEVERLDLLEDCRVKGIKITINVLTSPSVIRPEVPQLGAGVHALRGV